MLTHLRKKEDGLKFIVAVSWSGFPIAIEIPETHRQYWDECGGVFDEWVDHEKIPKKPGVYAVIANYEEKDYEAGETGGEYTVTECEELVLGKSKDET